MISGLFLMMPVIIQVLVHDPNTETINGITAVSIGLLMGLYSGIYIISHWDNVFPNILKSCQPYIHPTSVEQHLKLNFTTPSIVEVIQYSSHILSFVCVLHR